MLCVFYLERGSHLRILARQLNADSPVICRIVAPHQDIRGMAGKTENAKPLDYLPVNFCHLDNARL
jgi:hypothetical protein